MDAKVIIAKRVAQEFKDGDVVNLGIGIPTMAADYVSPNVHIILQSENGFTGLIPLQGEADPDCVNAGGKQVSIQSGGACFDSATSFAIIRGGHVAATVLGALEVDQEGNLANWMIPGKMVKGMGGAMDLVAGVPRVIVLMEHVAKKKDGTTDLKILPQCTLPLTGVGVVNRIITDLGVFDVTPQGLKVVELAPDVTFAHAQSQTGVPLLP